MMTPTASAPSAVPGGASQRAAPRAQPARPERFTIVALRTEEELLEVRNFGETTLKEVIIKLEERAMHLGMKLPAGARR